jgi:hypothetical protein
MGQIALANTGDINPAMQVPAHSGTVYGADRTGEPVLVVRDYLPWGGDVVPFFVAANTVVTEVSTAYLPYVDLSQFCLVFVTTGTATAGSPTEINMNAALTQLTNYVAGGGTLLYETGTWGAQLYLPGGVSTYYAYEGDNYFTGPNFLSYGMPYPLFQGNYASHDYLMGLPGAAFVLITNPAGVPTAATYPVGAGRVLALTQPIECYIPGGYCYPYYPHFNTLQQNAIEYARQIGDCGDPVVGAQDAPVAFELKGNYPNPFNPTTTIAFTLSETANVNLTVYDLTGAKVATLVNGMTERGAHEVSFNGDALSSGLYIYRLEAMGKVHSGRMMLVK